MTAMRQPQMPQTMSAASVGGDSDDQPEIYDDEPEFCDDRPDSELFDAVGDEAVEVLNNFTKLGYIKNTAVVNDSLLEASLKTV